MKGQVETYLVCRFWVKKYIWLVFIQRNIEVSTQDQNRVTRSPLEQTDKDVYSTTTRGVARRECPVVRIQGTGKKHTKPKFDFLVRILIRNVTRDRVCLTVLVIWNTLKWRRELKHVDCYWGGRSMTSERSLFLLLLTRLTLPRLRPPPPS